MNTFKDKNILVTGFAGFLGSCLCDRLRNEGATITGVDDFSFGKKKNINDNITVKEIDITSKEQVQNLFEDEKFDIVFHLAAVANPRTCKENFDLAFNVNVIGTKNVLTFSKNCDKVVFMSSASVYGEPLRIPIDEEHPTNGTDPYSITKIIGERLCLNFIKNYNRNITVVRNFNTFGIGQSTDYIVPTLITQAIKDKKIEIWNSNPIRDLSYLDDTVSALITLAKNGQSDIYNIGSGKGIRIGELVETIKNHFNNVQIIDLQKPVIGSPKLVADNSKLKSLGWSEQVGFEKGLALTIEWFQRKMN
jgi:UDP-glucose 4-epimerase